PSGSVAEDVGRRRPGAVGTRPDRPGGFGRAQDAEGNCFGQAGGARMGGPLADRIGRDPGEARRRMRIAEKEWLFWTEALTVTGSALPLVLPRALVIGLFATLVTAVDRNV